MFSLLSKFKNWKPIPLCWLFKKYGLKIPKFLIGHPAILFEYYNTGNDSIDYAYGASWQAQTFTPLARHKIISVKFLLNRYVSGYPLGTITASIRETDVDGKPTGSDLCSGTTNGDTLPVYPAAPEWREITLGAGCILKVNRKYAIVVRAPTTVYNAIVFQEDSSSPTYTRGEEAQSVNSGVSWVVDATDDFMFEDWGDPLPALRSSGFIF